MTIGELVRQGFYYARTCRSLWLFGFLVGMSGGSNGGSAGGGRGHGSGGGAGGFPLRNLSGTEIALIAGAIMLVVVAFIVLRFVGEGALIEGIVRARKGETMTVGEGFRAGWAHWGVLVRIALIYVAATLGSLAVLAAPCVLVFQTFGLRGAILYAIPALLLAVPWLVTLYLVQGFAWRIAVLENRQAVDAIRKARLFLHGRLIHGLKLIVATFLGSLGLALVGFAVMVPVGLVLIGLIPVLQIIPVIVLACVVLLPVIVVLTAMLGTFRSSVWTIGYVTQVES